MMDQTGKGRATISFFRRMEVAYILHEIDMVADHLDLNRPWLGPQA
jgi:hypothetical protein